VVLNEPRPYLSFTTHRVTYAKYKGNNGRQVIIKNSNDPKYYVVKDTLNIMVVEIMAMATVMEIVEIKEKVRVKVSFK
jgi:hypothetical protein